MRLTARAKRRAIPALRREDAAEDAWRRFRDLDWPLPQVAAVYSRSGSEIDPAPLAHWLIDQGVEVALPVVVAPGQALLFRRASEVILDEDIVVWGEPGPAAPQVQPDLIFVPLLAFDLAGRRLGQGKGYYDRTLRCRRELNPKTVALGLAFSKQEEPRIPTDANDEPLDGILTEAAFHDFRGLS